MTELRDIGQDKFGYIWVATIGGLNRYNGKTFTKYLHTTGDTLSPYRSQPRSIHSDLSGRLWIGFETGLMQYNFANKISSETNTSTIYSSIKL